MHQIKVTVSKCGKHSVNASPFLCLRGFLSEGDTRYLGSAYFSWFCIPVAKCLDWSICIWESPGDAKTKLHAPSLRILAPWGSWGCEIWCLKGRMVARVFALSHRSSPNYIVRHQVYSVSSPASFAPTLSVLCSTPICIYIYWCIFMYTYIHNKWHICTVYIYIYIIIYIYI